MAIIPIWNPVALEKARAFELAKKLSEILARYYPHLLPELQRVVDQLLPVRLSHGGRLLRAWGRSYYIKPEESSSIKLLVDAYYRKTKVIELPIESFRENAAFTDGIIATDNRGGFWLEETEEEKHKPILVMFPDQERSEPIGKQAMALAILAEHPDWSDAKIAERVGCSRTSLYEMDKFVAARAMLRQGRKRFKSN
jgi:hypothetical protein